MEEGLISKNPTIKCLNDYPYDPVGRRCALSEEETEVYLQFLERDKVYGAYIDIVRLILGTGLRRGEVLGLTWQNVDLMRMERELERLENRKKAQ